MNTCIECKHCKVEGLGVVVDMNPDPKMVLCLHPKAATREPIFGKAYCNNERGAGGKACGRSGKYWEAK